MALSVFERVWWPIGPDGKQDKTGEPKGRHWVFKVSGRDPNGLRVEVKRAAQVDTEKGARREAERVQRAIHAGTYGQQPKDAPKTFATAAEEFLTAMAVPGRLKPSTLANYQDLLRRVLVPALGKKLLVDVEGKPLDDFQVEHAKDHSTATVRNALAVLRACLRWCHRRKMLPARPVVEIPKDYRSKAATAPKGVSAEELRKLLDAADGPWMLWILFAARTGLRVGEMLAVRWDAIDLDVPEVRVLASIVDGEEFSPKSGKARRVPLSGQLVEALGKPPKGGGLVFPGLTTRHQVAGALARISKDAEVERIGPHALRHTFGYETVRRGVPLRTVQEWMGHHSLTQTEVYARGAAPAASIDVLDG
jgi:integrase